MGISKACVHDLEDFEDELETCYSPRDIQKFAQIFGAHPLDFIGGPPAQPPVFVSELPLRIHQHCHSRGISLEQFEDAAGWNIAASLDPPELLLENLSLAGLQDVCRELGLEWQRIVASF